MSGQSVPAHVRVKTRPRMAPIVAAHRRGVVGHPPVGGRHVRAVAWLVVAFGLSVAVAAFVAVLAITVAIGILAADLPLTLG
jgi:hypothetical protein